MHFQYLVVDSCTNVSIKLNGTASCLELYQCSNCNVEVTQIAPVILVQETSNCQFLLSDEYLMETKQYCTNSRNISMLTTTSGASLPIISNDNLRVRKPKTANLAFCDKGHQCATHFRATSCSFCNDNVTNNNSKEETVYYCYQCKVWICKPCGDAFTLNRQISSNDSISHLSVINIDFDILQRVKSNIFGFVSAINYDYLCSKCFVKNKLFVA